MTLKGAELLAWAQEKAVAAFGAQTLNECAIIIAEVYLRGAIDAVDEEVEHERQRGLALVKDRDVAESASVNGKV